MTEKPNADITNDILMVPVTAPDAVLGILRDRIRLAGYRHQWEEQAAAIEELTVYRINLAIDELVDRIEQASGIRP